MVRELLTFSGSRHLAKYCADIVALSVPLLSALFLRRAGDRHLTSYDSRWKSSEPHSVCIGCFCSWCHVGFCSKHVQRS